MVRFPLSRLVFLVFVGATAMWLLVGLNVPHRLYVVLYLCLSGAAGLLIRSDWAASFVVVSMLLAAGFYGLVAASV